MCPCISCVLIFHVFIYFMCPCISCVLLFHLTLYFLYPYVPYVLAFYVSLYFLCPYISCDFVYHVALYFMCLIFHVSLFQDLDMYCEETDTPAMARTSNLNEELGQVFHLYIVYCFFFVCGCEPKLLCKTPGLIVIIIFSE